VTGPRVEPHVYGEEIVVRGSFTPNDFHPRFLREAGLLDATAAERAEQDLLATGDIVAFSAGWVSVLVDREACIASTAALTTHQSLADFVVGLAAHSPNVPVQSCGFNFIGQFAVTPSLRSQVRDRLVGDRWTFLAQPHLNAIDVGSDRSDGFEGSINVRVEPSQQVRGGVFVLVNDHHRLATEGQSVEARAVAERLAIGWDAARDRAFAIFEELLPSE
jgi:hypothetical protein